MNTQHSSFWSRLALVTVFLCLLFVLNDAATQSQTPTRPDIKTAGGITTVTFYLEPGKLAVNLPDDIRAGDTISGTVLAEPKGQVPEERAKNHSVLVGLAVEIDGKRVEPFSGTPEKEREAVIQQTFWIYTATVSGRDNTVPIAVANRDGETLAQTSLMIGQMFDDIRKAAEGMTPSGAVITPDPKITQPTHPSGAIITPGPKTTNPPFSFPPVGQTGRLIAISGPFDGNSSNTTLNFGPARSTVQDFEKNTENVSGGFGLIRPLAESPRKLVFESPANVTGPVQLLLREGDAKTLAPFRNVGVSLSAPKTNLRKGEQTVLKVEVNGLEGITKDVPLQLESKGVILMDGGNFQNLRITPPEVNRDGKYFATRAITGQQAGAFTVVATVIVDRFDVCMADDSKRHSGILWNTFTGDYIFTNPAPPPRPGGQPPIGGTITPGSTPPAPPGGTSLTGTGKLARKGCVIVLTHNAPDRRVFARLDACTKTGEASVETTSPKTNFTITDKNITDNTCGSK
jgi:hypothetical protein